VKGGVKTVYATDMTMMPGATIGTVNGWQVQLIADAESCLRETAVGLRAKRAEIWRDRPQFIALTAKDFRRMNGESVQEDYGACLSISSARFNPMAMPMLVDWDRYAMDYTPSENGAVTSSVARRVLMTGTPGTSPWRGIGYEGYRYTRPLFIWPYGGNAGTGGTFAPRWNSGYFTNLPDTLYQDRWPWGLVKDGDALATATAEYLEQLSLPAAR
jgi:hypothetical protein